MSQQWKRMEAERLLLHKVACQEGLQHEGTLRQSRKVDEVVIEIMRYNGNNTQTEGLRQ
jgi:hypothetical protein